MSISDSINDALKRGRFESLNHLSKVTGIPFETLRRILKGQQPKEGHLDALAKVGIEPSFTLVGGKVVSVKMSEPTPFYAADKAISNINNPQELLNLQKKIITRIEEVTGQYNLAS